MKSFDGLPVEGVPMELPDYVMKAMAQRLSHRKQGYTRVSSYLPASFTALKERIAEYNYEPLKPPSWMSNALLFLGDVVGLRSSQLSSGGSVCVILGLLGFVAYQIFYQREQELYQGMHSKLSTKLSMYEQRLLARLEITVKVIAEEEYRAFLISFECLLEEWTRYEEYLKPTPVQRRLKQLTQCRQRIELYLQSMEVCLDKIYDQLQQFGESRVYEEVFHDELQPLLVDWIRKWWVRLHETIHDSIIL